MLYQAAHNRSWLRLLRFVVPVLALTVAITGRATGQTVFDQVDIHDGGVDVNESGAVDAGDDTTDILLFYNNAAAIRVDIINGLVDVNEGGTVNGADDLVNVDLPAVANNQAAIINGIVDVNEDGVISATDDVASVRFLRVTNSLVNQIDIIDGRADVTEDGVPERR